MPPSKLGFFSPPSTTPVSKISPAVSPGISPASTAKLLDVLQDNHAKYDIFFDERGFHNHATHHTIAIWSLGASAEAINAAYKANEDILKPLPEQTVVITEKNWKEHLGNNKFFAPYNAFFKRVVDEIGTKAALEKYIFSKEANFDSNYEHQPRMLDRFMAGIFHPMIHLGYGVEFGIPGMAIEGFALTAVHPIEIGDTPFVEESFWANDSDISKKVNGLSLNESDTDTHALTILKQVLEDAQFDNAIVGGHAMIDTYLHTSKTYGKAIVDYTAKWKLGLSTTEELERKLEEIQWMNTIVYGIGGWKKGDPFFADFVTMHLVTSSLFLPSLVSFLSRESQQKFLKVYLAYTLTFIIARGRPPLDIEGFFGPETLPRGEPAQPTYWSTLPRDSTLRDSWNQIIEMAIYSPDLHLAKLQRSLKHYSSLYGTRGAGHLANTGLAGAEKLDGTLFLRAASLTAERARKVVDMNLGDRGFWTQQVRDRGVPVE